MRRDGTRVRRWWVSRGAGVLPDVSGGEIRRLTGRDWVVAAVGLLVVLVVVKLPRFLMFGRGLPVGMADALQHLWVMRWYRECLLTGENPLVCEELQFPVGAPIGLFSPLHLQSILYLPLSLISSNDAVIYNVIWTTGLVTTGLGTFALGWKVSGSRLGAGLAGVLAMLSTPVMYHAETHLELIFLGGFPLFLLAWMRFVDQPGVGRLASALGAYFLLAMSAAYFVVFALVPPVLYLGRGVWLAGRDGWWAWLRARAGWLAVFGLVAGAGLGVLFAGHLWAAAHGVKVTRTGAEFGRFGAALWMYVVPTPQHRFFDWLPMAPGAGAWGGAEVERASYLGVVSLVLLGLAALGRMRFARVGFLWVLLGALVVLSMGSGIEVGGVNVPLPAGWLHEHFFAFRLIRVPARFNLFAAVIAAVIAGAAFGALVGRLRRRRLRVGLAAGVMGLAVVDLGFAIAPVEPPVMPGAYARILEAEPGAAILEVPLSGSMRAGRLNGATTYWQSLHRGRTSGGYSGQPNGEFDRRVTWASPFLAERLAAPGYLENPEAQRMDLVGTVRFRDYVWLTLKAHGFDYVMLHRWPGSELDLPSLSTARVEAELAGAKVYEEAGAVVYDWRRLEEPRAVTATPTVGWAGPSGWESKVTRGMGRQARMQIFNPDAGRDLRVRLEAMGFAADRLVTVSAGGRELGRWTVKRKEMGVFVSEAFRLPRGVSELVIEADGADAPRGQAVPGDGDRSELSVWVAALVVEE